MGTLVIRMTGSSLLVVGVGDGGGGWLVAPVEERGVLALCIVECLVLESGVSWEVADWPEWWRLWLVG